MKICLFEIEPWQQSQFSPLEAAHEVKYLPHPLTLENVDQVTDCEIISTFVHSRLPAALLARFSNLKLVTTRSTGVDHIDLDYCAGHGITVCNVPNYGDVTVAEHSIALLLALSRHITRAVERTSRGDFALEGLQGFDLCEKTLGVVGTGLVGRRVIEMARGFRMRVLARDIQPDDSLSRDLGFEYVPLERLLAESDVVSLHVPGTSATANLLSDREFALMKDGVVLINTARGSVVDSKAMIRALNSGKLCAAGLDVLPYEAVLRSREALAEAVTGSDVDHSRLLADQTLLQMPQVIVTPHNAFNTREAVGRLLAVSRENIERFAAGDPVNALRVL